MRLIGMLDSPFVRRVAISMQAMGLRYEHENLSVFSTYSAFAAINPVVKAPTLVTDSGVVLMESSLILDYLERLVTPEKRLSPPEVEAFARSQRIVGLALAACEKAVQIVYERNLRPSEKQHAPWTDRVTQQLRGGTAAHRGLDIRIGAATRRHHVGRCLAFYTRDDSRRGAGGRLPTARAACRASGGAAGISRGAVQVVAITGGGAP